MENNQDIQPAPQNVPELKEWETPTLVVEDIETVTRGGSETFKSPGDDTWYKS